MNELFITLILLAYWHGYLVGHNKACSDWEKALKMERGKDGTPGESR